MKRPLIVVFLCQQVILSLSVSARAADIYAEPADYTDKLAQLKPGDTLHLAAGEYTGGLKLAGLHGQDDAPIVITGPEAGSAIFRAAAGANTVNVENASYLVIRRLVLDGGDQKVDAIKAGGAERRPAHHITIEYNTIRGYGASRDVVAINTKVPAWDWVIRGNTIIAPGTGMYLGDSDGDQPFIHGIIENNLIADATGYCLQIKRQLARPVLPDMPPDPSPTIIRYNIFTKPSQTDQQTPRPNVLIGGLPDSGPGADDRYHVYGNVFYHNDTDSLFQGTGRISLHDSLFVDCKFPAITIKNHEGKPPKSIRIYHNSFLAVPQALRMSGLTEGGEQLMTANIIAHWAGPAKLTVDKEGNAIIDANAAGKVFACADLALGKCDLQPLSRIDVILPPGFLRTVRDDLDWFLDYAGTVKPDAAYCGAFAQVRNDSRPITATTRPAVKAPKPWE